MIKFLLRIFFISVAVIIFIFYAKDYHPFDKNDYQRIIDNNQITIAVRFGPTSYYQIKDKEIGYIDLMEELSGYDADNKLSLLKLYQQSDAIRNNQQRPYIESDIMYKNGTANISKSLLQLYTKTEKGIKNQPKFSIKFLKNGKYKLVIS